MSTAAPAFLLTDVSTKNSASRKKVNHNQIFHIQKFQVMVKFFSSLATLFCFAATVSFAAPAQNSAKIPVILRAGTSVFFELTDEFDASEVSVGNAINFTVRRDVTVNGKVLIAAGAPATGMIKKVKKSCGGNCSEITVVVETVQAVDGQTVFLNSIPHKFEAPCCDGSEAKANIGTLFTTNVRNDKTING